MNPETTNRNLLRFVCRTLAGVGFLFVPLIAFAAVTNYSTGFESAEGYSGGNALAGQQGWLGYAFSTSQISTNAGSAGNGITLGGLAGSGQAAYVGLTPPPAGYNNYVELVRNITLDPVGSNQPMVNFSVRAKIFDSTTNRYDYFYFEFFNQAGDFLFGLEFDNYNINFGVVNSTNGFARLAGYSYNTEYLIGVSMNFASNRFSVTRNGVLLTNNVPMTINGTTLNLGNVSAVWSLDIPTKPGDNYMMFDDLRLVSSPPVPPRPQLKVLTPGGSGAATLQLTGQDGFRFAVDGSTNLVNWLAVGTNILNGGTAPYTDGSATNKPARHYRARWVP